MVQAWKFWGKIYKDILVVTTMVFQSFTCNCSFKPSPHWVRSYAEVSCYYHYVQGSDITLWGWCEVDSNNEDTFGPLLDDDKEELNEYKGNGLGL